MNPIHTRRLIGGATALLGIWWVGSLIVPEACDLLIKDGGKLPSILYLLIIGPLMAIPGVLATVFGIRLFREMSTSSLKWVVGLFAVLFAFALPARVQLMLPELLPESIAMVYLFFSSLIAMLAYLLIVRKLLRHMTGEQPSYPSLISRNHISLLAMLTWICLFGLFDEYSPIKEGYTHIHEEPWDTLGTIVPITVAYVLFRCLAALLDKAQQTSAEHIITET